jgi:hypothetical protein
LDARGDTVHLPRWWGRAARRWTRGPQPSGRGGEVLGGGARASPVLPRGRTSLARASNGAPRGGESEVGEVGENL